MARKVRVTLPNVPLHILKKGINQESVFHDLEDYEIFHSYMVDISKKLAVTIYAYVLLKESFEVVISSSFEDNISKFMQILSQLYVLHYNKKYKRSGTIWEGRYKSSLIEKESYLNKVISYIDYISVQNRVENSICSSTKQSKNMDKDEIEFIQNALNSETITGSKEFIQTIKNTTGICFFEKKRGRPTNKHIKGDKMYKKIELLSKEKHSNLKIKALDNLLFAKDNPSFPVIISEAENVAVTLPIVFSAEENPSLFAITSLGSENLAMNREGKWLSSYVPAVYRKYPFAYANIKENPEQKAVVIDIEAENFSQTEGEALFDEQSNQTQLLKDTIQFLTSYEQEAIRTKSLAKIILDSGILEDRELSIGEGETKQVLVKGFKVVSVEKLNALDDAILASWVRNGIISFINIHLKSLNNLQNLMNLLYQRNN
ncbi:SapC family protein [Aliarcobacter cryaerophilus]|uniref:SapC family protein n=1 Tax=Aliarcobacter cryaerophilus TaxID=28198 RepID=UPI0021B2829D|nr:SapC family protein [Aliarcobacter cryaerophilus]MCT7508559.1 SapC family protein [Aliarcobacter cryaerophilus]